MIELLIYCQTQGVLGGRRMEIPLERMLGGSSAINTLIFTPVAKSNIDAWADLGNPGWGYASFSKWMSKAYNFPNSPWETNGHGPLSISIPAEDSGWPKVWRDTIAALGYPISMDPFTGEYYGAVASPEAVQPSSKQRSYVGSAYLQPALSRTNFTVWTETTVDKILFDTKPVAENKDSVAAGVRFTRNGEKGTVSARKEIILSAGTFHSPKILELSGVGDAKLLQSLGIEVVVDNPYVGENLQSHPYCTMTFEAVDHKDYQTIDDLIRQEPAAIAEAMKRYEQEKSGPFMKSGLNATAQPPLPSDLLTADGSSEFDRIFQECRDRAKPGKATPAFIKAHDSCALYSALRQKRRPCTIHLLDMPCLEVKVDLPQCQLESKIGSRQPRYWRTLSRVDLPTSRQNLHRPWDPLLIQSISLIHSTWRFFRGIYNSYMQSSEPSPLRVT